MSNSQEKLQRLLLKKGYENITVEKKIGRWNANALNPLKKYSVSFQDIGSNFEQAKKFLQAVEEVPHHYLCAFSQTCTDCGTIDQPIGFTNKEGDFIQKCSSCDFEWVANTAIEEEEAASSLREEAQEILNPVLRSFMNGKRS